MTFLATTLLLGLYRSVFHFKEMGSNNKFVNYKHVILIWGCLCLTFLWICSPWCSQKTMCTFAVPRATNEAVVIWYTCHTNSCLWSRNVGYQALTRQIIRKISRPLLSMIACMIRSKASVPHDIIQTEMGAAPIIFEALFRSMTCIQRFWEIP